jgi:DNA-binding IclR family transcriptional regulator
MIKMLEKSLTDITVYRQKFAHIQSLSAAALKVLNCFKDFPEIRLTTKKICEETGLPKCTAINSLNNLLRLGLAQRYGKGAGVKYQLAF